MFPPRRKYRIPLPSGCALDLGERVLIMGILNVTPDSFADSAHLVAGGAVDAERALEVALAMEAAGADILDVGGESTRPGSEPVSEAEELRRVLPILGTVAGRLRIPVSIDTCKAGVARAALAEGAVIVNDVSGLRYEPGLAAVVADAGAALVLMHMRGRPQAMYSEAQYDDVVAEVVAELRDSIGVATAAGVEADRLIVDPGVGFAKRAEHSYGVLARLPQLASALDRPVLVGPSRKSFLRDQAGDRPASDRDWGTAAAVAAAVLNGAHIVRVHAVAEMAHVVRVTEEIRRQGEIRHS